MAKPKNSSVIVQRRRDSTALPPCILGFSSLIEPDTYDPDKPMFKIDAHYNPNGIAQLVACIQSQCIEPNLAKLREEMADNSALKSLAGKDAITAEEWVGQKLKDPKEKSRIQLPKLTIAVRATYKDRSGETRQRDIGCWDGHNVVLDLKSLKLGSGSVIQPIVHANLFCSKTVNGGAPSPKLDLVGVRVLKLVRFGGARPPQETDEDAIREVLGEEFSMDEDLSAFAQALPGTSPTDTPPPAEDTVRGAF